MDATIVGMLGGLVFLVLIALSIWLLGRRK